MRFAVTGREGQVVRSLRERAAARGHEVVPLGRPELDLSGSADAINAAVASASPDAIISAAAYTAVDKAEDEPDVAFAVNEEGARALARAARELSIPIVHLSTDYVFDGRKSSPYSEEDSPAPAGTYGASKRAGEQAVMAETPDCAIVRTAWVYSPFGSNFVKTMLRLAGERDEIAVVADQHGNPTSALDVADGALSVAANLVAQRAPQLRGVFHMAAAGEASWAEFAGEIFAVSAELGGPSAQVKHIDSSQFPTRAVRPANSRLNSSRIARVHGVCLPDWQISLKEVLRRLLGTSN